MKPAIYAAVPDLAVEILSEANTEAEMDRKLHEYFQAGVRLVWRIEPKTRTSRAYTSVNTWREIGPHGSLSGGDVLPGFELPLAQLFARVEGPQECKVNRPQADIRDLRPAVHRRRASPDQWRSLRECSADFVALSPGITSRFSPVRAIRRTDSAIARRDASTVILRPMTALIPFTITPSLTARVSTAPVLELAYRRTSNDSMTGLLTIGFLWGRDGGRLSSRHGTREAEEWCERLVRDIAGAGRCP